MSTNFKQWDPNLNNIESDANYESDSLRQGGAAAGIFPKETFNKAMYQATSFITAFAKAMEAKGYLIEDGSAGTNGHDFNALTAQMANVLTKADTQYKRMYIAELDYPANGYSWPIPIVHGLGTDNVMVMAVAVEKTLVDYSFTFHTPLNMKQVFRGQTADGSTFSTSLTPDSGTIWLNYGRAGALHQPDFTVKVKVIIIAI